MLLQTAFMVGWIAVLYSGYFWIQVPLLMSDYTSYSGYFWIQVLLPKRIYV